MGERAVPNLNLADRPDLRDLTPDEIKTMYISSPTGVGKILKNQAAWAAYADIANAVVEGYREYILDLFTSEEDARKKREKEQKIPPPKWQFWK